MRSESHRAFDPDTVARIRHLYHEKGLSVPILAARFNRTRATISDVVKAVTYKNNQDGRSLRRSA